MTKKSDEALFPPVTPPMPPDPPPVPVDPLEQAKANRLTAEEEAQKRAEQHAGESAYGAPYEPIADDGTRRQSGAAGFSPHAHPGAYFNSPEHLLTTLAEHIRTTHGLAPDKEMMSKVLAYLSYHLAEAGFVDSPSAPDDSQR